MIRRSAAFLFLAQLLCEVDEARSQDLVTLDHHVVSARLEASPAELYVPKNIPGSLAVDIVTVGGAARTELERIGHGAYIEATLRGPAFPAYRLLGLPNEPLMLPPIALPGEYQIDDIRLVNMQDHTVKMMASPSSVQVHVYPEVLVSQVTSRPLTLAEIQDRGIVIDADSFGAVEFTATFLVYGRQLPIRFPVVTPKYKESTEIISDAELEERLVIASRLNRELAQTIKLPPALNLPGFHVQVAGANFEKVGDGLGESERRMPPIPAFLVMPGHVGFLNQFFSVQVYTANASPLQSGISVHNLRAEITLPQGSDPTSTEDEPLELAKIGEEALSFSTVALKTAGIDNVPGTADDQGRLGPGETGQGEFLIEGKREGLHVFDIKLLGTLDGFAHGEVAIEGHASGSVLVRNPKFSIAFSHPQTVRRNEAYSASLTILNTSEVDADLVSVNLHGNSISGARFANPNHTGVVNVGTIPPGESRTATFELVAEVTGSINFANLTGDHGLSGRFDLTMAVDDRGVPISATTIVYPTWVEGLDEDVFAAADRVLGHALSVSTAGLLPPGVRRISPEIITTRTLELTEAGQRIRYNDDAAKTYFDLLLDFHGGRTASLGFDQILRGTGSQSAGVDFQNAIYARLMSAQTSPVERLESTRRDLAGRHEAWGFAASDHAQIAATVTVNGAETGGAIADLSESARLSGAFGHLTAVRAPFARENELEVIFRVSAGSTTGHVSWTAIDDHGQGTAVTFNVASDAQADVCYHYFPQNNARTATIDLGCLNTSSGTTATFATTTFIENPPEVQVVLQDVEPLVMRPNPPCGGPTFQRFGHPATYNNYGTVVAVLFSKVMDAELVERPGTFELDDGTQTNGVKLQPGGRVALINLKKPIGGLIGHPHYLEIEDLFDRGGQALISSTQEIKTFAGEVLPNRGVQIAGRVLGVDGAPARNVPVTLIMNDEMSTPVGCLTVDVRVAQVRSRDDGSFNFEFVMSESPAGYTIAATDTRGFDQRAIDLLAEASPNGPLDPEELARIATEPGAVDAFIEAFGTENFYSAIARAESVDRATFHDSIGESRERTTVHVALRFRGRGTVSGRVLTEEGIPVAGAAINLYPDTTSRELGRGLYSNADGSFSFAGVPLGAFTIHAQDGEDRSRVVAGRLNRTGEQVEMEIVLNPASAETGIFQGRIFEADGIEPHKNARVAIVGRAIGEADSPVLALVDANEDGFYQTPSVRDGPVEVIAISADGRRSRTRYVLDMQAPLPTYINLELPGTAQVLGRVLFDDGQPAPRALVAGGESVVEADDQGRFTLTGVPVGRTTISAALPASANNPFTRFGSTALDVVPDVITPAIIRLVPAGRVRGRVYKRTGCTAPDEECPHGGVRVAMPTDVGFSWVDADAAGNYEFPNLPLGEYRVAASAPPVHDIFGEVIPELTSDPRDQLIAALEAYRGINSSDEDDTLIQPESGYGFARARILYDGQTAQADIHYLVRGTISGTVRNENDIPIRAEVVLYAVVRGKTGAPFFREAGRTFSDPISGDFSFGGVNVGRWEVVAESPFYSMKPREGDFTTAGNPNDTDTILRFAPDQPPGTVAGTVLMDNGAVPGARVTYAFGRYTATASDQGQFVSVPLSSGQQQFHALHVESGRVGSAWVNVVPGAQVPLTIPLLTDDATIEVTVQYPDETRVQGASVEAWRSGDPSDTAGDNTDVNGEAQLLHLIEGEYFVRACEGTSLTRICASADGPVRLIGDANASITVTLQGSGSVRGTYVEADGVTPVEGVQITVGRFGFAVTGEDGSFLAEGVPAGTHTITGRNPVTGRAATARAQILGANHVAAVLLREDALGDVVGRVLGADGATGVPGAQVRLDVANPLFPDVAITSDPSGRFQFPGVPPGRFELFARDVANQASGQTTGEMPPAAGIVERDIMMPARASLRVTVRNPDESLNFNAQVWLDNGTPISTPQGFADFTNVPLGTVRISARAVGTHSTAIETTPLTQPGQAADVTIFLSGVGSVGAYLTTSAGTPVPNAELALEMRDQISGVVPAVVGITDSTGRYTFNNVALGDVHVRAGSVGLIASAHAELTQNARHADVELAFGPSTNVTGVLVLPNGNFIPNNEMLIEYTKANGQRGVARTRGNASGVFNFADIPSGPAVIRAVVPRFDGVLYEEVELEPGDEDLGPLAIDTVRPSVLSTLPDDGDTQVSVSNPILITFSEPMKTTERYTDPRAISLRKGNVPIEAELSWLEGETTLSIQPEDELESQTTYNVVIAAGEVLSPVGQELAFGPVDLAERPLSAAKIFSFTTIDSIRPEVIFTPADGARQLSLNTVIRAELNEAVEDVVFQLVRDGELVPVGGTTAIGLDRRLAVFTPNLPLRPNSKYTASLISAHDLANNDVQPFPEHEFWTIDTVGPRVVGLEIAGGRAPVAHTTVTLVATLHADDEDDEDDVQLELNDLTNLTLSPRPSLQIPYTFGDPGPVTLRVRAIDRYGNPSGVPFSRTFTVVGNTQPVVQIVREVPATGPLLSGQQYRLRINATDDSAVASIHASVSGAETRSIDNEGQTSLVLDGTVPANAGPGSRLIIDASATDNLAATGHATPFDAEIEDGVEPMIEFTPELSSTINNNGTTQIGVLATDAFGIIDLNFRATGQVNLDLDAEVSGPTASVSRSFEVFVPSYIEHGTTVSLRVQAHDEAEHLGEAIHTFTVRDNLRPHVAHVEPDDGDTAIDPQTTISILFSEPVLGVSEDTIKLVLGTEEIPIDIAWADEDTLAEITPVSVLELGATYQLVFLNDQIFDLHDNELVEHTSSFTTIAPDGPRLLSVSPTNLATLVMPDTSIELRFDRALSLTAELVVLENAATNAPIARSMLHFNPGEGSPNHRYLLIPDQFTMSPNTSYRVRLNGLVPVDAAQHRIVDANGANFTELAWTYTTANIALAVDGPGRVVEDATENLRLTSNTTSNVRVSHWRIDGVQSDGTPGSTSRNFTVPSLNGQPARPMILGADAQGNGGGFVVPDLTVIIESAQDDFDQDGLTNGEEAAVQLNPWVADSSADPDGDTLSNHAELHPELHPELFTDFATRPATNPLNADTDSDGVPDQEDSEPTLRPIVAGVVTLSEFNLVAGTLILPSAARAQPPMTFEFWVRPAGGFNTITYATGGAFNVRYNGPAQRFEIGINNGSFYQVPFTSSPGTWHHIALVFAANGSGIQPTAYVDGRPIGALPAITSSTLEYASEFSLAAPIDEVRVWNVALSGQELRHGMHRVARVDDPGLRVVWHLNHAIGIVALGEGPSAENANTNCNCASNARWSNLVAPVFRDQLRLTTYAEQFRLRAFDWNGAETNVAIAGVEEGALLYEALSSGAFIAINDPVETGDIYANGTAINYLTPAGFQGSTTLSIAATIPATGRVGEPVDVEIIRAPSIMTWTPNPSTSTEWLAPANWTPFGVPSANNHVVIGDNATVQVGLTISQIDSLELGAGSHLYVDSQTPFFVTSLSINGPITGAGRIHSIPGLAADSASVQWSAPNISVSGSFDALANSSSAGGVMRLSGDTSTGPFVIRDGLDVGPHTLSVAGNLTINFTRALNRFSMLDAASAVSVTGNVTSNGTAGTISATNGVLALGGNFVANRFLATADHILRFAGPSTSGTPQAITINSTTGVRLANIEIESGAYLRPASSFSADTLTVSGGLTVPSGVTITVRELVIEAGATVSVSGSIAAPGLLSCTIDPTANVSGFSCP